jgi:hypothetical protein
MRRLRLPILVAVDTALAVLDWLTTRYLYSLRALIIRPEVWYQDLREGDEWYDHRPSGEPGELLVRVYTRVEPSDWSERKWAGDDVYILIAIRSDRPGYPRSFTTWTGTGGENGAIHTWNESDFYRLFRRLGWSK